MEQLQIIKEFFISEDEVIYLQKTEYEYLGLKNIVETIIRHGEEKYNKKYYEDFLERYQEKHSEYKLILSELFDRYAGELVGMDDIKMIVLYGPCAIRFVREESCKRCQKH